MKIKIYFYFLSHLNIEIGINNNGIDKVILVYVGFSTSKFKSLQWNFMICGDVFFKWSDNFITVIYIYDI